MHIGAGVWKLQWMTMWDVFCDTVYFTQVGNSKYWILFYQPQLISDDFIHYTTAWNYRRVY